MAEVCPCPVPAMIKTPFQLSVKAGVGVGPVVGAALYINLVLVNALDVNVIYVNNTPETVLALQFTFDPVAGRIRRYQGDGVTLNPWVLGDVLVMNYNKLV